MRRSDFRPWSRFYPAARAPEHFHARTADGLRLAIHRVAPPQGSGPAVVLCHGLSSNHLGLHFPGRSLAGWLAAHGYDVYLPDLRGSGASERPADHWDLDDHVFRDVPAVIDAVLRHSRRDRVHWVGHSMGGVVLFCHGISHPGAPVASGVTIASSLDYTEGESGYRELLPIRHLLEKLPGIPYGAAMHLLAPVLCRRPGRIESFQVWHPNIEPEIVRQLLAIGFHSVPIKLLASLATTFEPGGLCDRRRALRYLEEAKRFRVPTRLLAGSRDRQVAVPAVEKTAGQLGGLAEVHVFGTEQGHADEYGHWDLVLGRRARAEVWPRILEWLRLHERPAV